jgi:hypothetical protein
MAPAAFRGASPDQSRDNGWAGRSLCGGWASTSPESSAAMVMTPADLERTEVTAGLGTGRGYFRRDACGGGRAVAGACPQAAVQVGKVAIVIEVKLVCDGCAAVIGDGISAINVRVEAQGCYQRRQGRDLCLVCAALPPNGQTSARRKYWGKPHARPRRAQ